MSGLLTFVYNGKVKVQPLLMLLKVRDNVTHLHVWPVGESYSVECGSGYQFQPVARKSETK